MCVLYYYYTGTAFAAFWLQVMRKYSSQIIFLNVVLNVIFLGIAMILSFAVGAIFMGIIYLLLAFVAGLWYYMVRHRIPFAQVNYKWISLNFT